MAADSLLGQFVGAKVTKRERPDTPHTQSLSRYQSKLPARTQMGSRTHTRADASSDSNTGSAPDRLFPRQQQEANLSAASWPMPINTVVPAHTDIS